MRASMGKSWRRGRERRPDLIMRGSLRVQRRLADIGSRPIRPATRSLRMSRHRSRTLGDRPLSPETLMMGYGYDPVLSEGSIKAPIFQTSTFVFQSAE